jgi:mRNA-degrading endonuclease RelE of RelBE toxin-antitoxin system
MNLSAKWGMMPTKVNTIPEFEKEVKHLKRKYPSVVTEIRKLIIQLENDERLGDRIPNIGYEVYKVRLSNPSATRGKSGGFRAIYYVQLIDNLYLITIYSKTEQEDISPDEIRQLIETMSESEDEDSDLDK